MLCPSAPRSKSMDCQPWPRGAAWTPWLVALGGALPRPMCPVGSLEAGRKPVYWLGSAGGMTARSSVSSRWSTRAKPVSTVRTRPSHRAAQDPDRRSQGGVALLGLATPQHARGIVRGIPGIDKPPRPRITGAFRNRDGGPVISLETAGLLRAVMADSPSTRRAIGPRRAESTKSSTRGARAEANVRSALLTTGGDYVVGRRPSTVRQAVAPLTRRSPGRDDRGADAERGDQPGAAGRARGRGPGRPRPRVGAAARRRRLRRRHPGCRRAARPAAAVAYRGASRRAARPVPGGAAGHRARPPRPRRGDGR